MGRITISRELGIDMGHRVTNHASKCKSLHGHRYKIVVTLTGPIVLEGEEEGMVMDYGFLKQVMMDVIDAPCDHGTCLWVDDPQLAHALGPNYESIRVQVLRNGHRETFWSWGKLYVLDKVPTAENLAAHWALRVDLELARIHVNQVTPRPRVVRVDVWETPNCVATWEDTRLPLQSVV